MTALPDILWSTDLNGTTASADGMTTPGEQCGISVDSAWCRGGSCAALWAANFRSMHRQVARLDLIAQAVSDGDHK